MEVPLQRLRRAIFLCQPRAGPLRMNHISLLTASHGARKIAVHMQPIDEPEELRRLEDLYARTGDGDLRALADKLDELKEVARHALRAETSERGLAMETHDAPTDDLLPRDDDV